MYIVGFRLIIYLIIYNTGLQSLTSNEKKRFNLEKKLALIVKVTNPT